MSTYLIFCNLQVCFDIHTFKTARFAGLLLHSPEGMRKFA